MSAPHRRSAGLLAAILVLLSLTSFACTRTVSASERPSSTPATSTTAAAATPAASTPSTATGAATTGAATTSTKMYTLKAGGLTRQYEVITGGTALPKTAPVIVMLSGIGAKVPQEVTRDLLTPYAATGKAEIVYPVAIQQSWNAGGCCKYAWAHRVNDMAFLEALVATLDPGHARPIYLAGYSNGARLAYRVACTVPALFDAYAMVKGGPMPGCVVTKPTSIAQLASLDDPEVPYKPGEKGLEPTAVLTEIARLHAADKCPAAKAVARHAMVTLDEWTGCASGTRLELATWTDGKHSFPRPPFSIPSAAQVIWSFFTKSPLRALPA